MAGEMRSFDELVNEAADVPVDGWDFSWLEGRATEQRPSWGYQRLLGRRLSSATAALDIQTGGGEVLAGAGAENFPPTMVATEGWPPNVAKATALLHPLGAVVVADRGAPTTAVRRRRLRSRDQPPPGHGPLAGDRSRAGTRWDLLRSTCGRRRQRRDQRVLPRTTRSGNRRHHAVEADAARTAGLEIVQCRNERLELEFFDVGAVVFFLRKVIWTVPDFTSTATALGCGSSTTRSTVTASSVRRRPGRSSKPTRPACSVSTSCDDRPVTDAMLALTTGRRHRAWALSTRP